MTSEERARQRKIIVTTAGAAAVLIAAVIGLTVGETAAPEEPDPTRTSKENFVEARKSAITEVRGEAAKEGYLAGRKSGSSLGGRSGRRAGESDGAVQAQLEITSVAQSAAANAQAELDGISAPPPAPVVPEVPFPGQGR